MVRRAQEEKLHLPVFSFNREIASSFLRVTRFKNEQFRLVQEFSNVQNITWMGIDGDAQHSIAALRWRIAQLSKDHAVARAGSRVPLPR